MIVTAKAQVCCGRAGVGHERSCPRFLCEILRGSVNERLLLTPYALLRIFARSPDVNFGINALSPIGFDRLDPGSTSRAEARAGVPETLRAQAWVGGLSRWYHVAPCSTSTCCCDVAFLKRAATECKALCKCMAHGDSCGTHPIYSYYSAP